MLIDITGVILIPGNQGKDCPGNGEDETIECCCDECDYMLCCLDTEYPDHCATCSERDCPRNGEVDQK
ncbi:MAG: hypothetical protein IJW45_09680 [Oscillospiraceae bacterium]|nr:hypothetical protein [Oscillospiraceae bacterium]